MSATAQPSLRRTGLIIPSSNRMVEQEMTAAYPAGVIAHVTRLRMTGKHGGQSLASLAPKVTEATGALADAKCEIVTFHCTANSMAEGPEGEALLLDAMAEAGATRVSSTATAMRRALISLGARRIVLVTPYSQQQTEHEAEFFSAIGIEVVRAIGHGLPDSDAYCATPAVTWRDNVLAARHPDADAYFLSCANIATFGVIDALEAVLDRPVISSNQVVVWDQLRQIGWSGLSRPPGRLFSQV